MERPGRAIAIRENHAWEQLPYKVIDRVLVTDHDQWDLYLSENNFKHGNGVLSINETISDQIIAHLVRLALSASMNTSFKVIRVSPSLD
jgi:hypothetical protein